MWNQLSSSRPNLNQKKFAKFRPDLTQCKYTHSINNEGKYVCSKRKENGHWEMYESLACLD